MTHRAKSFIVCLIGLPITFLGWAYESRLVWDIGIITFVIAFLASLVKHDQVTYQAIPKVKKERPISPEEYERGRKEFTEWLEGIISEGFGASEMHLDLGDKQKPVEVLNELNRDSDLGKAFLDLYIYNNRKNWREHYSDEEWSLARQKILTLFRECENLDETKVYVGTDSYTARQIIECIKSENEIGVKHIMNCAREEFG